MRNWIMGSLAVIDHRFAVSHCALNNSIITSNTMLCRHVYIWSECGHADSTWRKVPRLLLHDKHRFELVYLHNFRLVVCRGMLPRGKGRSIPLPYDVWINRPQGLTATRTPWPIIGWTEKGIQIALVARPEEIVGEERKKWLARPFSAKMIPFRQRKFGKESLVWGQKLADKDAGLQPKLWGSP